MPQLPYQQLVFDFGLSVVLAHFLACDAILRDSRHVLLTHALVCDFLEPVQVLLNGLVSFEHGSPVTVSQAWRVLHSFFD